MIRRNVLGAASACILVGILGSLGAACSAEETAEEPITRETAQAASVSLDVESDSGAMLGRASGVLIAPRLVLTSAHLVAGMSKWTVTAADGKTTAIGVRAKTYDWMRYDSAKAHPRRNDVAVIYLDRPIKLRAYPKLASDKVASGAQGIRIRGTGQSFEAIDTTLSRLKSFPNAYVTDLSNSETLDTGGAVFNAKNEIVGLVSGRGTTTGKLYIARTDKLVAFLTPKIACGGGSTGVRVYVPPPPSTSSSGGGTTSGSSSGGGTTSGSSSGGSYGSPGASSSGAGASSGGGSKNLPPGSTDNPNCEDGGGNTFPSTSGVVELPPGVAEPPPPPEVDGTVLPPPSSQFGLSVLPGGRLFDPPLVAPAPLELAPGVP